MGQELPKVHKYNIPNKEKVRQERQSQSAKAKILEEVLVEASPQLSADLTTETSPAFPTVTTESLELTTLETQLCLALVSTSIKTSPIAFPLMTTANQTYTTTRRGGTPPSPFPGPPRRGSPALPPINNSQGGGDGDGAEGGPPGGLGSDPNPLVAQQLCEIKLMGQISAVYVEDRTLTESFIDSLKMYFQLNHQAPNFWSYLTRIALALTLL